MPLETRQNRFLIDSNSYFRLAKSLDPLLNKTFGKENNCIYILKDCEEEYSKNLSLQNKFRWVNQVEHVQNRKTGLFDCSPYDNEIRNNIRFIKVHAQENYLTVSEVDIKYLATALELDITLITDDSDMIAVANEFGIRVMKTLELLKLMLDCGHIDIEKVKEITTFWIYLKDTPKNFKEDCKAIFNL